MDPMPGSPRPLCLGISGGSGSGKSWLAQYLQKALGRRAVTVCQDWYYRDNGRLKGEAARKLNFDHPKAIESSLLCRHLQSLLGGRAISAPCYDYATHARLTETRRVEPAPLIILDGLLILAEPKIRALLDFSVFIESPSDERLLRRIRRDVAFRRVDLEETLRVYELCARPMHDRFIQPSSAHATWIWRQNEDKVFPADLLRTLEGRLESAAPKA
jgi:uridine kinase